MADYFWVILVAISSIAWIISISLQRFVLKDKTSIIGYNALYALIASLFFIPFLFSAKFPSNPEAWKFYLIAMGIWCFAGIALRLQFKYVDVPLQTVLATIETLFAFGLGVALLSEGITQMKIFGLAAIVAGIIISGKGNYPKKFLATAIAVVFLASFLSASANVVEKYTIQFFDPFFFGFSMFFIPGIFSLLFVRGERLKETKALILKSKWFVAGAALLSAISYFALLLAYKIPTTEVSVIYPLYEFFMLAAIPVSAIITGEKQNLFWKTVGAVVATVGAILILGF